ncbi:uncharacterized protein LOC126840058 [Adelges cooleyi]|uniref:uncharacterized protein LOC126840058 n=1 Tax=Adelges cooleyi TaxID=133065 RepID=UPI0021802552|nr:uncharacterized protein LOC126840058 [Adelges cooleyi]
MEYEVFDGFRKNSKLHHSNDGFFYRVKKVRLSSTSLSCIKPNCTARGMIYFYFIGLIRNDRFEVIGLHNHDPDMEYLSAVRVKSQILYRCSTELTSLKVIYDEEITQLNHVNTQLTYTSFLRTMERARAEAQPSIPQTLLGYAGNLSDPRYRHLFLTSSNEELYRGYIDGGVEAGEAVVFISPAMMK